MRNSRFIVLSTRTFFIALLVIACALSAQAQPRPEYSNPAIAGDYPDPSVIRVGRDYWATATTSEWAPEFPLLRSRDLVNWQVTGAVFHKRPSWSDGNYWAPEIAEYRGRYYVYYVGHKKGGSLCVAVASASRPQGPYTDHGPLVCQDAGSIDAMPVTDENGQRYLTWKEDGNSRKLPTPIWAQRLSNDGTKLIGEKRELIRNDSPWEAQLVEGPFILKRGGWFYMFYSGNACCGRECNYALGVARSRNLLGPWEKNPQNPILKGNDTWKCPGHGSIVTDAKGLDFLLYHAYRAKDFVYVGRQALLDEIKWDASGWPTINGGNGPSERADSPLGTPKGADDHFFVDQFDGPRLGPGWQWPQSNEPIITLARKPVSHLVLAPTREHANNPLGAVVARSTTKGDYMAQALMDTKGMKAGALAGLAAYGDGDNALGVAFGNGKLVVWRREKNEHKTIATTAAPASRRLYLRMTARQGHFYRFAFSTDAKNWNDLGEEINGNYLPPWDRGVRIALTCGGTVGASARFEWLNITPSH
jgi:xylan 1,4-beta-xylosidase